jgi:hypothetical protein|tara:strand:- start:13 stop:537 length:525 start_codon:yes stop_codon:yes gene_type:complete
MENNTQGEPSFEAAIPGQSMTTQLGSYPWEKPPKYTTVEEALSFYIPKITNPRAVGSILNNLEAGIPVTTMANVLQLNGVMEGLHTIDVGVLISPVVMELLAFVAEEAGIEYDMGTDLDEYDEAEDSPASIALALQRVEKEDTTMETDVEETTMPVEDELEMSGTALGLMSRRA